ncbi:DDHD domain-containing protein [Erysiphe neolycopersici]|uniref:DDHD domain-containing protein n=1 Tax=Erysiphe neolycopersici TaxID=212602 RepID=A0A420HD89_9PEZI|nr:DDHD domain-containing protein [Erysiphe neolycopersici]
MPFRYPKAPEKLNLKTGDAPNSLALSGAFSRKRTGSGEINPKASSENLRAANQQALDDAATRMKDAPPPNPHQPQSYRLFGTYMNSIVTYQDSTVAWLSVDSIMSRVSSSVYERFAGGAYLGGIKLMTNSFRSTLTRKNTWCRLNKKTQIFLYPQSLEYWQQIRRFNMMP